MKKLFMCLLCTLGILLCMAFSPQDEAPTVKECKKISRQLEKEGWTVHPTGQALESALANYYDQQRREKLTCIIGTGEAKNVNTALRKSVSNAKQQYASQKGSQVSGSFVSKFEGGTTDNAEEGRETYSSSFSNSIDQHIKTLKPVLTLKRQRDDKTIEVMVYCLVKPEL